MKRLIIALSFAAMLFPSGTFAAAISPDALTAANGWTCGRPASGSLSATRDCTHTDGRTASCTMGRAQVESCTVSGTASQPQAQGTGPRSQPSEAGLAQASGESSGFVPLTDIPAVRAVAETNDLGEFFNYLYVLAVGAAAVIAVLQFVRAGIMYAVMDTGVVEKREAKNLMVVSVLGLLLVLSPAVVFGIINPDILSLRIGVPGGVAPTPPASAPTAPTSTAQTTPIRQTCTIDGAVATMQNALNAQRQRQATGTISLNIQPYGEPGMGCCRAVRDTDGQACSARETQSFTNTGGAANGGGRLIINYYCTCDGPQ